MTRYAAIVDPVSTGQEYAEAFSAAGIAPIAVLSGSERLASARESWHPERFAHTLHIDDFPGGPAELAARLRSFDPICLIPGSEVGVLLYEALVTLVAPESGNVAELADARRDKWAMAQALATSGVPRLRQICSADPAEIQAWIARERLAGAHLVVKPPKSAATDEVHIVPPGDGWRPLVDRLVGKVNLTGLVNEAVLVQEFADGPELLVDSYSVDGVHGLVDVCRYTKVRRGDRIGIYDRVDFLPPEHPHVRAVWPYVQDVLDAVGIRNGCGHSEVVLTSEGPRLLEVAERPAGGGHQLISKLATGDNHILRTVAHRVHGRFEPGYQLVQHVRGVFLSAPIAGMLRNPEVFDQVDQVPTFYAKQLPHGAGDFVPQTVDLSNILGWVVLAGPYEAEIDADYRRIKAMESAINIGGAQAAA
jgi:hypothetical protein